jgi:hypothetical protein
LRMPRRTSGWVPPSCFRALRPCAASGLKSGHQKAKEKIKKTKRKDGDENLNTPYRGSMNELTPLLFTSVAGKSVLSAAYDSQRGSLQSTSFLRTIRRRATDLCTFTLPAFSSTSSSTSKRPSLPTDTTRPAERMVPSSPGLLQHRFTQIPTCSKRPGVPVIYLRFDASKRFATWKSFTFWTVLPSVSVGLSVNGKIIINRESEKQRNGWWEI